MDAGELPRGQVTNYALLDVLDPIAKATAYDRAVETLDFLDRSGVFRL